MTAVGDVVLECRNVCTRYGSTAVLENVSTEVRAGEVHAFVGLNGAGKTTLMRLFLGMIEPDDGIVRVRGLAPASMPARHWTGVGHLVETPLLYPELTVTQNLRIAGRLAGLSAAGATAAADRWIEELVLTRWARTSARKLSLGNRQRLGLAAALIADPDVLILDEPTNALDPAGIMLLRTLLQRSRERGAATLVSSHHLDEVARVADRITVVNEGRTVGALDPRGIDLERQFFDLVYRDSEARR
ncbi:MULTISPECIES: ABC transporter ATP-binding protein [Rhodococcus]|uniref:ABC transporter n=1 Tax=Rhodococcus rhodochrous KG-21 TaxID=1441923 RepID=A0A0M8PD85_RHORH|nr:MULTISPECIES: ABC transporter ATP-binding protein [Rhodococcus]KOS54016.1 ABC transporter [Rhodococcus rhodochrous KG-21]QDC14286.1 ATP-binding cassette domain-containing protein [Rhodococcus ruber]